MLQNSGHRIIGQMSPYAHDLGALDIYILAHIVGEIGRPHISGSIIGKISQSVEGAQSPETDGGNFIAGDGAQIDFFLF